jgi:cytochrome oxidase Cu insertion factor (SCO1/SenC/PrrC family)
MPGKRPPYASIIGLIALLIVAVVVFRFFFIGSHGDNSSDLKRICTVPAFSLTDRSGRTITNNDLFGKIWVADFVYTTCPGPCPLVTASMAKVQAATKDDPNVQLVTFTVDPQNDTPAVLAAYADHFGADKNRWWFLTGPEKPLYDLIQNGFLQAVQDNRGTSSGPFTVTHSTYFALVDGSDTVRGFYDSLDPKDRAQMLADIQTLEKEKS